MMYLDFAFAAAFTVMAVLIGLGHMQLGKWASVAAMTCLAVISLGDALEVLPL